MKKMKLVIKVGSSSLTEPSGGLNLEYIDKLAWEISILKKRGIDLVLVSSAAISAGASLLQLDERPRDTQLKQAASAVGQPALIRTYQYAFSQTQYQVAQLLLTNIILNNAEMYNNVKNTFDTLFKLNIIPIVNENDAISVFEIEFGDNDRLATVVAQIIDADLVIFLSDIDGLYTDDPRSNPDSVLIKKVDKLTEDILNMGKNSSSKVGTGGMQTKLKAAESCLNAGIDMVIANGADPSVLRRILDGESIGTLFSKGG